LTTVPTELCDAAITRIRVLYKQVCVHLPDNAALPSFARHTPLLVSPAVQQAIDIFCLHWPVAANP